MKIVVHEAEEGGVDVTAKRYAKCLEPKLLNGIALDDKATVWLVGTLSATRPKELADFVNKNAASLAGLMKSDAEYGPGQVLAMTSAMLSQESADVRTAAVKVLMAVPSDLREEFAERGGLEAVRFLLASGNEAEAAAAVELLMLYSLDSTKELLGASWEQLPSDALKQKVKAHLGIVE